MKEILEKCFKDVLDVFSAEQAVYILVRSILLLYLENNRKKDKAPLADGELFYEGALVEQLRGVDGYDVKEAAWMLEHMIDWDFIRDYEPVKRRLADTVSLLRDLRIHTTEELNDGIETVLELFSPDSQVMVTPSDIKQIIVKLANKKSFDSMAEFCCGFSGLGLEVLKNFDPDRVSCYGEDINRFCCVVSRLWMCLNGFSRTRIVSRDTLLFEEDKVKPEEFDLILADIPKGMNESSQIGWGDKRFTEPPRKSIYTDWIFIQDILYRLSKEGTAFAVVTKGALVRKNELDLRKQVIEKDWLEAVITLPQNLYTNTNIGMELLVFNKRKRSAFQKKVLFASLSSFGYRRSRNQYGISVEGIEKLLACFEQEIPEEGIGKRVDCSVIERFDYTLNPFFYLELEKFESDLGTGIELGEIASVTRGVQISKEDEKALAVDGTHYLLNIRNIENDRINFNDCIKIREKSNSWKEKFEIREDDIVLATKGTVFKMALVQKNPPPAFIGGNLTIIRVDQRCYHAYVLYEFLHSNEGRRLLESVQTGTTIKVLNSSSLLKVKVPGYENNVIQQVGNELKKNQERFVKKQTELEAEYRENKESWMSLLRRGK